jgi:hypothetical protein
VLLGPAVFWEKGRLYCGCRFLQVAGLRNGFHSGFMNHRDFAQVPTFSRWPRPALWPGLHICG